MQETLEKVVPNVVPAYTQPIQMRVEELISGVRATLALKLYGTDLGELDRLSTALKDVLGGVQGVADLSLEANIGKPQIRISVNRDEMARHGMNAEDVLTIVRNGLGGEPVSVLLDGVRRFDIAVRLGRCGAHQRGGAAAHPAADGDRRHRALVRGGDHRGRRRLFLRSPRAVAALCSDPDGRARTRHRRLRPRFERRHRPRR
jgi:Putative silver efflux pump